MDSIFTHNDLSFLQMAVRIAIKEFRENPELEGKYGPTATSNAISKYRELEDKIECKLLSL